MGIHWLIFIAAIVIMVQAFVYGRFGLKKIGYSRYFSTASAFEGDEVELVEEIVNKKLLPLPWLRLESMFHAGLLFHSQTNLDISGGQIYQNHKSMFSMLPFTKITRRHRITCMKRGCYQLNTVSMTCGDVLGFGTASRTFALNAELLVFPKPALLDDIVLPSHSWQGDVTVRRWIVEDPFMIAGVREYEQGDPQHAVNWKATARTGRLQVHKRDYTADHRLLVYVNFENSEQMWDAVQDPELIEQGLRIAASVIGYAIEQGIETGFGCNGHLLNEKLPVRIAPQSGGEQLHVILEAMARAVIARSVPFNVFLEDEVELETRNSDILILSAFVSNKIQMQIDRLKRQGNSVEVIHLTQDNSTPVEEAG